MQSIQDLFRAERWPIVSGVYFDSGEVVLIQCALEFWVRPVARSRLESIVEINREWMTSLNVLFTAQGARAGLYVECGEGSEGSEGFVGLSQRDGHLLWLAYFENSNPFVTAAIEGGRISARRQIWATDGPSRSISLAQGVTTQLLRLRPGPMLVHDNQRHTIHAMPRPINQPTIPKNGRNMT